MAYAKIQAGPVTIGTQTVGTVVVGPIKIDGGIADIGMLVKTAAGGATTPTAYKLQVSLDDLGTVFGDVASASITATAGANTIVNMAPATNVVGKWVQVVSGAAFAAGSAQLYVFGIER